MHGNCISIGNSAQNNTCAYSDLPNKNAKAKLLAVQTVGHVFGTMDSLISSWLPHSVTIDPALAKLDTGPVQSAGAEMVQACICHNRARVCEKSKSTYRILPQTPCLHRSKTLKPEPPPPKLSKPYARQDDTTIGSSLTSRCVHAGAKGSIAAFRTLRVGELRALGFRV